MIKLKKATKASVFLETAPFFDIKQKKECFNHEKDVLFMNKLIEALEDNDDVQNIYHNWDAPSEEE